MIPIIMSLLFWGFILITSFILFPIALLIWLVTFLFDRRLVILHIFTSFWASLYTWLNPLWRVTINGRERIYSKRTYIIVSNHQSLVDILVLFRLFVHYKWVSKIEIFKVPLIGWNMVLNRYIKLNRGSTASNREMMLACEKTLEAGSSILMFPEGTRSPDGEIRSFKKGAFELALKTKKSILPIAIEGSSKALPKKGFILKGKHQIRVQVLDEIPYQNFANDSVDTLTEKVHLIIKDEIERIRNEYRISNQ
ncbi:MAG: 1-acyl-sn-glycerol-3-phosphate acyltransferase [Leptospiraceae bacterium]|nr:1-acyl-sn-glycerol-3-phosphate acyltransferase [Leptospiraceae bacterium]